MNLKTESYSDKMRSVREKKEIIIKKSVRSTMGERESQYLGIGDVRSRRHSLCLGFRRRKVWTEIAYWSAGGRGFAEGCARLRAKLGWGFGKLGI